MIRRHFLQIWKKGRNIELCNTWWWFMRDCDWVFCWCLTSRYHLIHSTQNWTCYTITWSNLNRVEEEYGISKSLTSIAEINIRLSQGSMLWSALSFPNTTLANSKKLIWIYLLKLRHQMNWSLVHGWHRAKLGQPKNWKSCLVRNTDHLNIKLVD